MTVKEFCASAEIGTGQFYGKRVISRETLDLTRFTSIPRNFKPCVDGDINLRSLETIPEGFEPYTSGNLDLSSIRELPEWFSPEVGGRLILGDYDVFLQAQNCLEVNAIECGEHFWEREYEWRQDELDSITPKELTLTDSLSYTDAIEYFNLKGRVYSDQSQELTRQIFEANKQESYTIEQIIHLTKDHLCSLSFKIHHLGVKAVSEKLFGK